MVRSRRTQQGQQSSASSSLSAAAKASDPEEKPLGADQPLATSPSDQLHSTPRPRSNHGSSSPAVAPPVAVAIASSSEERSGPPGYHRSHSTTGTIDDEDGQDQDQADAHYLHHQPPPRSAGARRRPTTTIASSPSPPAAVEAVLPTVVAAAAAVSEGHDASRIEQASPTSSYCPPLRPLSTSPSASPSRAAPLSIPHPQSIANTLVINTVTSPSHSGRSSPTNSGYDILMSSRPSPTGGSPITGIAAVRGSIAKRRRVSGQSSTVRGTEQGSSSSADPSSLTLGDGKRRQRLASPGSNKLRYELSIVQQPTAGCAFGSNLLSRLPCSPPLILRLRIFDEEGNEVSSLEEESSLLCQCYLLTESGQPADMIAPADIPSNQQSSASSPTPASHSPSVTRRLSDVAAAAAAEDPPESSQASSSMTPSFLRRSSRSIATQQLSPTTTLASSSRRTSSSTTAPARATAATTSTMSSPTRSSGTSTPSITSPVRMLYGSLVASPRTFQAEEGGSEEGLFFVFPEICVRTRGRFRLRIVLRRLPTPQDSPTTSTARTSPSSSSTPMARSPSATDGLTEVITEPITVVLAPDYIAPHITDVTRHFARQGAALPLPSSEID